MDALSTDTMLLALVLARSLQSLHLAHADHSLIAKLGLSLGYLSVGAAHDGYGVRLHVHVAAASTHQDSILLLINWTASPTTVVIIRVVMHLMSVLLG